ncbi:MAG: type III-B CRISPR module RAMP protein Cmr6 [Chloroflexi bacterium]|nr:type III-B CRISPR module RAMP protein Cmr6 [Chloroflexota bacterium]
MTKYYLPKKTATTLEWYEQSRQPQQPRNIGLLLDKYMPAEVINKQEAEDQKKDGRTNWLRKMGKEYRNDDKLAQAAYHRWYSYTSALYASHFSAKIDWRLIVGLGGNTVLETDLTLHHLYGQPIIPGSALKGLTRTYAAMEDKEMYMSDADGQLKPSTVIDTDHDDIRRIFGMTEEQGTVIFFDAFPKGGEVTLVLDIMNPHYPDYYQGNVAPSNDQNPIPIAFLAVDQETTYMFALALRQGVAEGHKEDLTKAKIWLGKALENYGVGGKTSAGYGYFGQITEQPRLAEAEYASPGQIAEPYVRPNIPIFREGQKIQGTVLDPQRDAGTLERTQRGDASFCLRYREFPTRQVLIVIPSGHSGVENWRPGNTKHCTFVREEIQGNCTVLICKP